MKETGKTKRIVLVAKSLGKRVNENGRIKVVFSNGDSYSLRFANIKDIYYLNGLFYIVYETENPEFYEKYSVPELPMHAVSVAFYLVEYEEERCEKCGSPILWDADEPYCPKCGSGFPGYIKMKVREIKLEDRPIEEAKEFCEKLLGVKCGLEDTLYSSAAGGFTPLFSMDRVNVELYSVKVKRLAVVDNPAFKESHYDELEIYERTYTGKFVVIEVMEKKTAKINYVLFRIQGEPSS